MLDTLASCLSISFFFSSLWIFKCSRFSSRDGAASSLVFYCMYEHCAFILLNKVSCWIQRRKPAVSFLRACQSLLENWLNCFAMFMVAWANYVLSFIYAFLVHFHFQQLLTQMYLLSFALGISPGVCLDQGWANFLTPGPQWVAQFDRGEQESLLSHRDFNTHTHTHKIMFSWIFYLI